MININIEKAVYEKYQSTNNRLEEYLNKEKEIIKRLLEVIFIVAITPLLFIIYLILVIDMKFEISSIYDIVE